MSILDWAILFFSNWKFINKIITFFRSFFLTLDSNFEKIFFLFNHEQTSFSHMKSIKRYVYVFRIRTIFENNLYATSRISCRKLYCFCGYWVVRNRFIIILPSKLGFVDIEGVEKTFNLDRIFKTISMLSIIFYSIFHALFCPTCQFNFQYLYKQL